MSEIFQIICRKCGATASTGENMHHAETLAKAQGFIQRPDSWECGDCGGVKKMVTSDIPHYKKMGIEKT